MKEPGTTTLKRIREGKLDEELAEAIETAVERMKATGKDSEVILRLKFKPAGVEKGTKGDAIDRVWIDDEVKLKLPALPKATTLQFVDPDGGVTDKNPQQEIPGVRSA